MAIVKMKRVDIVGPVDAGRPLLQTLQEIAVLDPVALKDVEEAPAELTAKRMNVQRVLTALEQRRKELKKEAPEMSVRVDNHTAIATVERADKLLSRRSEMDSRLSQLTKEHSQLEPWGDFDPAELLALADKGTYLQVFVTTADKVEELDLSGLRWHVQIPLGKAKQVGIAALTLDEAPQIGIDPTPLPDRSLSAIKAEIDECEAQNAKDADEMGRLTANLLSVKRYDAHLQDRLRFAEVHAGFGGDDELFAMTGWCPVNRVDELQQAIKGQPLAVMLDDPADDEEPPIKLRNIALVRQFQPLLGAFNLPNYREYDPTLFIAPFMGIFFGFCLGDMGYGVVLTIVTLLALNRFELKGDAKLAVQWLFILGVCTVVVGGLTGNVFGVQYYNALGLSPDLALFRLTEDPKIFFYVSLGMGVVQLTLGLLIKWWAQMRQGKWQALLGTTGWVLVFPSIYVGVTYSIWWAFVAVLAAILVFAAPSPSVVRRLGGGAWALYNVIGLVGDVVSYARIFGLGLSSGIIAAVVNTIALSIVEGVGPIAGWPIAIVVMLIGHTFNFVMAMIGSVVHPARLQFLEFFGKFFEGGGRAYAPFGKLEGK